MAEINVHLLGLRIEGRSIQSDRSTCIKSPARKAFNHSMYVRVAGLGVLAA